MLFSFFFLFLLKFANVVVKDPFIVRHISSAHQFREFSRPTVAKYLLIFLTGDDLQANSERHLIDQLGVEPVLV